MGVEKNVGFDDYPVQGQFLHTRVRVCFDYDTSHVIMGTVVRDDTVEPGRMIIRLDDGRYVMSTECQYQPVRTEV